MEWIAVKDGLPPEESQINTLWFDVWVGGAQGEATAVGVYCWNARATILVLHDNQNATVGNSSIVLLVYLRMGARCLEPLDLF